MVATFVAALSACDPSGEVPTAPRASGAPRAAAVPNGLEGPKTLDGRFAQVAAIVPEFGGFYTENGRRVIVLTDTTRLGAAIAAIQLALGEADHGSVARQGQYGFAQLQQWQHQLLGLLRGHGVTFLDADEAHNRVTLGVRDATAAVALQSAAASLGVPTAAVRFEVTGPITSLTSLVDNKVRPTAAGLQIVRRGGANPSGGDSLFACTLGATVYSSQAGAYGFITNSHCTATHFGPDGSAFYQNNPYDASTKLGNERIDPPSLSGCDPSSGYAACRWTDAAFIQYDPGVNYHVGLLARTTSGLTIDTGHPFHFNNNSGQASSGASVSKTGQSSGTSSGTVTNTCIYVPAGSDDMLLMCQSRATLSANAGDSGSPVWVNQPNPNYTYTAALGGILWGGENCDATGHNCSSILFSDAGFLTSDLGGSFDYYYQ